MTLIGNNSAYARAGAVAIAVTIAAGTIHAAAPDVRLVRAARDQNLKTVRELLRQKADVNSAEGDGATALLWAAQWDHVEMADLLIAAGADVNRANDLGVTPLSMACTNHSVRMVERLLTAGADPDRPLVSGE